MDLHIEIENFRSIRQTRIDLHRGLNILIGPNGSGKTNLLCALKFIRDVLHDGAALAMGRAGGPVRNYTRGQREIVFRARSSYGNCLLDRRSVPFEVEWELRIAQRGDGQFPAISKEKFSVFATRGSRRTTALDLSVTRPRTGNPETRVRMIEESRLGRDFFRRVDGALYSGKKAVIFDTAKESLTRLLLFAKKSVDKSILPALSILQPQIYFFIRQLSLLEEYNILPDAARAASDQVPNPQMKNDGSGLSEIIYVLASGQYRRLYGRAGFFSAAEYGPIARIGTHRWAMPYSVHRVTHPLNYRELQKEDKLGEISTHLSAAVSAIDSIDTEIDPTTGRRFVVFWSGGQKFRPEEVSDGTIKWLCLLTAILVPFVRTFLLEEPENFMHPWMQQKLIEIMREQSKTAELIFVVTSHSATVLNSASPNEIILVERKRGATSVSRIKDVEKISAALKNSRFGLGDLWVSGGIDAVPRGDS